jgi:hypothetical protein
MLAVASALSGLLAAIREKTFVPSSGAEVAIAAMVAPAMDPGILIRLAIVSTAATVTSATTARTISAVTKMTSWTETVSMTIPPVR